MENEGPSYDSDTSEELPDLFQKTTFEIAKLKKNEIVWAPYKDLHWPALVRSVDGKNKKVKVWYLDSPGKCFNVPFKKIHDFSDVEFKNIVHKDAKLNPLSQKHHEVFRRSLLFIFRRTVLGIQDDPADFFDTSKPYFLLRDCISGNSELKLTSENASTEKVADNDDLEDSSEAESLPESDKESRPDTKFFPELYVEDSPYDDEMVDTILSCIKAGHVDDHLMDVVNSKIACERHDLYVEAVKTCNIELLSNSPPYIPINNHEKLHNVSIYLFDLYERKIGKGKPKMTEYVVSVWLPEAVDKAISLVEAGNNNVSNSPLKLEASESPVESTSSNIISSPKMLPSSIKNNSKKCRGRKKRKGQVKALASPKKLAVQKMTKPDKGNLVTSTLATNASGSKASS